MEHYKLKNGFYEIRRRFLESDEEKIMITYIYCPCMQHTYFQLFVLHEPIDIYNLGTIPQKIQFTLRKNSKRIIFSEVEVTLHTLLSRQSLGDF